MHTFQLQAIRSKVFLFFIDKYALECEWFINLYLYAREHSQKHHLPILIPIIFDDELEADDFEDDAQTKFDKNLKLKLISELTRDIIREEIDGKEPTHTPNNKKPLPLTFL